jgi:hypothetical protein
MEYIRKTYGVPAKRGGRVEYTSGAKFTTQGVITGSSGPYLRIKLDINRVSLRFHPQTDGLVYLPAPNAQQHSEGQKP